MEEKEKGRTAATYCFRLGKERCEDKFGGDALRNNTQCCAALFTEAV